MNTHRGYTLPICKCFALLTPVLIVLYATHAASLWWWCTATAYFIICVASFITDEQSRHKEIHFSELFITCLVVTVTINKLKSFWTHTHKKNPKAISDALDSPQSADISFHKQSQYKSIRLYPSNGGVPYSLVEIQRLSKLGFLRQSLDKITCNDLWV